MRSTIGMNGDQADLQYLMHMVSHFIEEGLAA